jgi:hypothetical protein
MTAIPLRALVRVKASSLGLDNYGGSFWYVVGVVCRDRPRFYMLSDHPDKPWRALVEASRVERHEEAA